MKQTNERRCKLCHCVNKIQNVSYLDIPFTYNDTDLFSFVPGSELCDSDQIALWSLGSSCDGLHYGTTCICSNVFIGYYEVAQENGPKVLPSKQSHNANESNLKMADSNPTPRHHLSLSCQSGRQYKAHIYFRL